MTARVRHATSADAAALADLRMEMDAEEGVVASDGFSERFVSWFASRANEYEALVAEAEGEMVGTLWLAFMERVPRPSEEPAAPLARLTFFFVRPTARNAGVGAALLREARRRVDERGAELVLVWPSDRAVPLYERHGYASPADLLVLDLGT